MFKIDLNSNWTSFFAENASKGEVFFLSFCDPVPYTQMQVLQKHLHDLRVKDLIPDVFLVLEHTPVITQGRGLQKEVRENLNLSLDQRNLSLTHALPPGIDFAETERGGDLTYHGPGQLVIYPIIKLDDRHFLATEKDIPKYIRALEHWLIYSLKKIDLHAESKKGTAGVWVQEKKIASVGIACQNFTTYHGIALNCVNDLGPFRLFSPCGLQAEVMTHLLEQKPELEDTFDFTPWREWTERLVFDSLQELLGTSFLLTRKFCDLEGNLP